MLEQTSPEALPELADDPATIQEIPPAVAEPEESEPNQPIDRSVAPESAPPAASFQPDTSELDEEEADLSDDTAALQLATTGLSRTTVPKPPEPVPRSVVTAIPPSVIRPPTEEDTAHSRRDPDSLPTTDRIVEPPRTPDPVPPVAYQDHLPTTRQPDRTSPQTPAAPKPRPDQASEAPVRDPAAVSQTTPAAIPNDREIVQDEELGLGGEREEGDAVWDGRGTLAATGGSDDMDAWAARYYGNYRTGPDKPSGDLREYPGEISSEEITSADDQTPGDDPPRTPAMSVRDRERPPEEAPADEQPKIDVAEIRDDEKAAKYDAAIDQMMGGLPITYLDQEFVSISRNDADTVSAFRQIPDNAIAVSTMNLQLPTGNQLMVGTLKELALLQQRLVLKADLDLQDPEHTKQVVHEGEHDVAARILRAAGCAYFAHLWRVADSKADRPRIAWQLTHAPYGFTTTKLGLAAYMAYPKVPSEEDMITITSMGYTIDEIAEKALRLNASGISRMIPIPQSYRPPAIEPLPRWRLPGILHR